MPWQSHSAPTMIERVIAGLSYMTAGIAGIIYLLVTRNSAQSQLFRFHAYQSILLVLILMLIRWGSSFLMHMLGPLFALAGPETGVMLFNGTAFAFDIFEKAYYLLLVYGAIMAFLGKTAEVPFISNVVRQNMRV